VLRASAAGREVAELEFTVGESSGLPIRFAPR